MIELLAVVALLAAAASEASKQGSSPSLPSAWSRDQIDRFSSAYQRFLVEALDPLLRGEYLSQAEYGRRLRYVVEVELPKLSRSWAETQGVRFLGSGFFRSVFAIPNGALKVSTMARNPGVPEAGVRSNLNEIWIDATVPSHVRPLLVPLVDRDPAGNWVLMELVATGSADPARADQIRAVLAPMGITDVQAKNLSLDGRLLDYGEIEDRNLWASHTEAATIEGESRKTLSEAGLSLPAKVKDQAQVNAVLKEAVSARRVEDAVAWLLAKGVPPHMIWAAKFILRYRWWFYPTVVDLLPKNWQEAIDEAVRADAAKDAKLLAPFLREHGVDVR